MRQENESLRQIFGKRGFSLTVLHLSKSQLSQTDKSLELIEKKGWERDGGSKVEKEKGE